MKDSTEDSAKSEVEFHLDTNPEATYNSLLTHLKTALQTSETFETLIAQFYSKTQKVKETFDEYGDEIQNLGRRIIAVNPKWRKEANAAMKHQLVTGMQDLGLQPLARTHLEASVDFDLSYTSFRAKLARLFGTRVKGKQTALLTTTKGQIKEIVSEAISSGSGYGITASTQSTDISHETQTDRPQRQNNPRYYQGNSYNLGNDIIPGVDGKTWQYTACNYCKNKGHIARLCLKLAAKKARDAQSKKMIRLISKVIKINNGQTQKTRCGHRYKLNYDQKRILRLKGADYKRKV